jgi:hypothetical protein
MAAVVLLVSGGGGLPILIIFTYHQFRGSSNQNRSRTTSGQGYLDATIA